MDWIGHVVRIELDKETWEGKERNKATRFHPSDHDTGPSGAKRRRSELKQESDGQLADDDIPFF